MQRGLVAWQRAPARVESVSTAGLTAIEAVELPFGSAFVAQEEVEATYRYAGTPAWIEARLKASVFGQSAFDPKPSASRW